MKGLKSNTLADAFSWFCNQIASKYDSHEARSVAGIVFEHCFQVTSLQLVTQKDQRLTESDIVALYKIIKKLLRDLPVQQITGKGHFRYLALSVNESVLIPRPETEELVQWILDDSKASPVKNKILKTWDIGTGSGAIALSLARELPFAEVWASDISADALDVAKKNAAMNQCEVTFIHHNILMDEAPATDFDVLVSNPPYIRKSEKALMKNNVLNFEPHLALFVPDHDPLLFYRAIGLTAGKILKPGGKLYVEINEALGSETVELFLSLGFINVEIRKDIFGKDRFVKAWGLQPH